MKRDLVIVGLTAFLSIILTRSACKSPDPKPSIPTIITKHDTVHTVRLDTIWKLHTKHTTDTVNLVITNTIVDTQVINVNAPPEERRNVWPLLAYHGGAKFGDTAVVSTFSLRSGRLGVSKVFIPGILIAIDAGEGDEASVPKMSFEPFPAQKGTPLLQRLKYVLIGAAAHALYTTVKP